MLGIQRPKYFYGDRGRIAGDELRFGTFLPFLRASDKPIAMACFRLLTLPPRPPFPRLRVPRLRRRMALLTSFDALREYFRAIEILQNYVPRLTVFLLAGRGTLAANSR
jgi:hypothetical protein